MGVGVVWALSSRAMVIRETRSSQVRRLACKRMGGLFRVWSLLFEEIKSYEHSLPIMNIVEGTRACPLSLASPAQRTRKEKMEGTTSMSAASASHASSPPPSPPCPCPPPPASFPTTRLAASGEADRFQISPALSSLQLGPCQALARPLARPASSPC
jgi:hypothetical protein